MNEIEKENMLKQWALMACINLGADVNKVTRSMNGLVKAVLKDGRTQVDIWNYDSEFNTMLLEFSRVCKGFKGYEDLNVVMHIDEVTMIDRSYVRITPKGLDDFNTYLMINKSYIEWYRIASQLMKIWPNVRGLM